MSHSNSSPWWQGGNDDDLRRNPYARENERQTTTSGFVGRKELIGGSKPAFETEPRNTGRSENERERISSRQASSRYDRDYSAVDRPQNATRSSSGASSSPARRSSNEKQRMKWSCTACT